MGLTLMGSLQGALETVSLSPRLVMLRVLETRQKHSKFYRNAVPSPVQPGFDQPPAVWRQSSAGPGLGSHSARQGRGGGASRPPVQLGSSSVQPQGGLCVGTGVHQACLCHGPCRDEVSPSSGSSEGLTLPARASDPTGESALGPHASIRASLRQKESTAGRLPPNLSLAHRRPHTHALWFLGWRHGSD